MMKIQLVIKNIVNIVFKNQNLYKLIIILFIFNLVYLKESDFNVILYLLK